MVNEVEKTSGFNGVLAAGVSERIINKPSQGFLWNRLLITNRDAVAVQVMLDGRTDGGYIYELKAGDGMLLEEGDGIQFVSVDIKNLDGAVATVANKILLRASRVL